MNWSEIFFTATNYLPLVLLLFAVVLIFPALALFPTLIRPPLLATSLPIVSILVVNTIGFFLFHFKLYTHHLVLLITIFLFLSGIYRSLQYFRKHSLAWDKSYLYILLINVSILLPLIAFCGLSSFRTNDALASWNYWALHFYHGEVPDTIGYPPFFPMFIAYCYKILGNTDYQGVVKVLLVAFPLTMINAIAFASAKTKNFNIFYLLLACICVFPRFLTFSFYGFHAIGYADSLLAAAISASLILMLKYLADPAKKEYLFFAICCGITASLSKQPGLLWCFSAMPALIIAKNITQKRFEKLDWIALFILFIPATF
jgi:hypothetical protein